MQPIKKEDLLLAHYKIKICTTTNKKIKLNNDVK